MENNETCFNLLDMAYKCKPADLESMLERIELAIKNSELTDKSLLRAKTVITCKLASYYSNDY